jgi:hypothetical protein
MAVAWFGQHPKPLKEQIGETRTFPGPPLRAAHSDRRVAVGTRISPRPPGHRRRSSAVKLRAQARPPGTEFLDAETGRQKSPPKCANAHGDQNPEVSGRKSPQKRPIRRRTGNGRFAETGWWCAQSDTNRSPGGNSLLTGNFTGNFAISGLPRSIS